MGKSPVRTLFKNRPVLPRQVAAPKLVGRKQTVTMVFANGAITIQDIGEAMEDGAMNEMIRVKNTNSNIIVHAKVIGDNLVKVQPGQALAASKY